MNAILEGKVTPTLTKMSVPISIGMLSTFLFQVIDTYFVGQLGGDALAALSFASVVYFIIVGTFMGLSIGVSTLVGKAIGEKNFLKMEQIVITSLLFTLFTSVGASIFIDVSQATLFTWLGAPLEMLPLIDQYMHTLMIGIPLLTIGLLMGSILRASGSVSQPEIVMAVAGVINLVLDYGLIFGKWGLPELGITGAAMATVVSWVFILIMMSLLFLNQSILKLNFSITTIPFIQHLRDILQIGVPTMLSNLVSPLTQLFLTLLLAYHSSMAVAAFGVAGRIEMLSLIGILGVSTAITPFIAQNLGAELKDRNDKAIVFGGKAAVYLGIIVVLILFIFNQNIAQLFSDDVTVMDYTSDYFIWVSVSYIFYGLFLVTTSILNGLQKPQQSLQIMVIKTLVFTVPLALIGSYFYEVIGIFMGIGLSNILGGIYASYMMRKEINNSSSSLKGVDILQDYKNDFIVRNTAKPL
ncbi:MATE family efflux transporter [Flammeovirga yaeyamensis]|uniref:MATE family efflux transporter n=1 Tax=Flammeovirga yaeyamensis TaxID=367791 RepID=A0AAX1N7B3_9BACT|nr:MATE family efflux transporter [Flammeovirga yaeyamensis]MBB3697718.1 putative MATE family efflux protein [Flammeovirga yaeyamensis]NMF35924.1 MATE family efflux transporter [Flammeovirga yaeyamensis]QWG03126.1 MATE family efflux transporter [Flammeovirga yaeyamensis]